MSFSCSQCGFTSNFESALLMHRQLHHDEPTAQDLLKSHNLKKTNTLPGMSSNFLDSNQPHKELKLPTRTSSATRLLGRLRARICRGQSSALFSHPEDPVGDNNDLCMLSACTSKAFKEELPLATTRSEAVGNVTQKETFRCHLCNFEADRITILDRHLLDDHKIGIDNLLKLVMAKTQDGLSDGGNTDPYTRQPYYKPQDQLEEGEFIIETVQPKIKILKHAATNTENSGLTDNFKMITNEMEKMMSNCPVKEIPSEEKELLLKMQSLKEYMRKFEDSYCMLKKMTKEFDTKSRSDHTEPVFHLRLGDKKWNYFSIQVFQGLVEHPWHNIKEAKLHIVVTGSKTGSYFKKVFDRLGTSKKFKLGS